MRLLVLAVLLLAPCLGAGCSRAERKDAEMQEIPQLADLPPELRRAFEPGSDFEPVPEPAFGDWLQQHPEKGQTFEQFVQSKPLRPDARRNKIYFQPLGDFGEDAPSLDLLERFAEAFFALEVEVLPVSRFEEGPQVAWRFHGWGRQHRQYLTGDILARLGKQVPRDAYALLGITMEDIYPGPNWNYVFGMATLRKRVGVYSFARYDPAFYDEPQPADWRSLMLRRSCKVLAHETGHMFGIHHCTAFHCLMNGSNHLQEADTRPLHLCPVDLRKLHLGAGFDPVERYRKLLAFSEEVGFQDEAAWLRRRIVHVTGD